MNLKDLTAAPWKAVDSRFEPEEYSVDGELVLDVGIVGWAILGGGGDPQQDGWALLHGEAGNGTIVPQRDDLEFIALARNAFDVLMRRGWHPSRDSAGGWWCEYVHAPDPFTALVLADEWYKTREGEEAGE